MKRLSALVSTVALLLAAACTGLTTGCEADSATEDLTVEPSSVTVEKGQTVEFTVSGGYDYTWALQPDDGSGKLSNKSGNSTVYTCISTNGATPKRVVVTSTIKGVSSSSSNTSSYATEGSANIYYKGGGEGGNSALAISASADTLTNGASAVLTATGGKPAYNWTKSTTARGILTPTSGQSITYKYSGDAGTVVVTCTDGNSASKSVTITQL